MLPANRAAAGAGKARGDAVTRAMTAAGGRDVLSRVRVLSWSGSIKMVLASVPVDLLVEMRIEPFVRARSDSWLASDGRSSMRTVMIERDRGFLVSDGAQTAMPPEQAQFERQRLGAYAYLLLAPAFVSAAGGNRLHATREGYPPIALALGADGRIASADYAIAAPDPDAAAVRQHFTFAGSVSAQGVRFPRTTTIVQNGRPSLRQTITDFSVELNPA